MTADRADPIRLRSDYARAVLAAAGVRDDPRLEDAFANVPRERHLGPAPWRIEGMFGMDEFARDLAGIYQDRLVALDVAKGVNNGVPSLHAGWLRQADVQPGERVVHIGAGTGYYSAILARLVGRRGAVTAVEYDAALARRARDALADLPHVEVMNADGAFWPREETDVVYVNFGVERPASAWIERLAPGGRLIFPLAAPGRGGLGVGLALCRVGDAYSTRALGRVRFIAARGGQGELANAEERAALAAAFARGDVARARSLIWRRPADPARCVFVGEGWALSLDPPRPESI